MLVDKRREGLGPLIERRAGVKFERIGTPQPRDMARSAGAPTSGCVHPHVSCSLS